MDFFGKDCLGIMENKEAVESMLPLLVRNNQDLENCNNLKMMIQRCHEKDLITNTEKEKIESIIHA